MRSLKRTRRCVPTLTKGISCVTAQIVIFPCPHEHNHRSLISYHTYLETNAIYKINKTIHSPMYPISREPLEERDVQHICEQFEDAVVGDDEQGGAGNVHVGGAPGADDEAGAPPTCTLPAPPCSSSPTTA